MNSIRNKIAGKIKNTSAFSLAETLVAILILLMVSIVVATGMPAARNAYEKVVKASEAEVLLSTTISTLRNEIGVSEDVNVASDSVTYINQTIGSASMISKGEYEFTFGRGNGEKKVTILYRKYAESDLSHGADKGNLLISERITGGDLYVSYDQVTYSNGIVKFIDLEVKDFNDKVWTKRDTVSIRVVND